LELVMISSCLLACRHGPSHWLGAAGSFTKHLHATGPPTLDPSLPPEQAAFRNPAVAALYLGYMGLLMVVCTAFHCAIIFAWTHIKWTAAKPIPDLLQFPAAELLLLNLLALPAAMYSMLLMVQAPVQAQRALGVFVFLLVLGYLWFIMALLLFIIRNKTALGLCVTAGDSSRRAPGVGRARSALAAAMARYAARSHSSSSQHSGLQHLEPRLGLSSQPSVHDSAMALLMETQPSS
jgi:hypothetical protein